MGIRVSNWWSERWLWVVGGSLGVLVCAVAGVAWILANKPVAGTEGLILQEQMLIAVVNSLLVYAVAMTAMHSSKLAMRRETLDRQKERHGHVLALVGAAMECAGYAGWLAALQHFGLKWYRRPLPETAAQREFTVAAWRLLATSAASVSRALETIRYEEPDLAQRAGDLFDAVSEALEAAPHGDQPGLEQSAMRIREVADDLHQSVMAAA